VLNAEIIRPDALTREDRAAWQGLRATSPAFASPLLGPDFAEAVGAARSDAAVAVFRRDGRAVGFLAHHRRPNGLARPIGSPFSDYHALIAEPDLTGEEALRLAGLREYRFSALVDPHAALASATVGEDEGHAIVLGAASPTAGADYLEGLRAGSPKRFKNVRRLDHKLEREMGAIAVRAPDHDPAVFDAMFAWKREQFLRTGLHDVFAPAWTRRLMRALFERREGPLQGLMITMTVAGQPAVMHFGVREADRFHPWIAAQDTALAAFSPGQTFLWRAIEAMPDMGLNVYDLAAGHDHYKTPFANVAIPIGEGALRLVPGLEGEAWRLAESALGANGAGRLRRRMDQIASVELTLGGRVKGMVHALASRSRRDQTRPAEPPPVEG
jgi:CelD/BcsL family acetyltransferase involved in cellulose biosynthesis